MELVGSLVGWSVGRLFYIATIELLQNPAASFMDGGNVNLTKFMQSQQTGVNSVMYSMWNGFPMIVPRHVITQLTTLC